MLQVPHTGHCGRGRSGWGRRGRQHLPVLALYFHLGLWAGGDRKEEKFEAAMLPTLKRRTGSPSQGMWETLEGGKGKDTALLWSPREEHSPATPDVSPGRPAPDG